MMNEIISQSNNFMTFLFQETFWERIVKQDPSHSDLIILVLQVAMVWFVVFQTLIQTFLYFAKDTEWLRQVAIVDYHRSGKEMGKDLGNEMTQDEYIPFFIQQYPWFHCIALQHLVGALLCLPSLLGILDNANLTTSLAALSIVSEMGWELSDAVTLVYKRFFTASGHKVVPTSVLVLLLIHHSFSLGLGLPALVMARNSRTLHWLCFELQAAAAFALGSNEYTKLLDITVPRQLRQFQVLNGLNLVILIGTRLFHGPILMAQMCRMFYQQGSLALTGVAVVLCLLFTLFSLAFFLVPATKKFLKFRHVAADYQQLSTNASPTQRRNSVQALQEAAQDVWDTPVTSWQDAVLQLLSAPGDVPPRRQTAPPSRMSIATHKSPQDVVNSRRSSDLAAAVLAAERTTGAHRKLQ